MFGYRVTPAERAAGTAFRAVACVLAAARSSGGKEDQNVAMRTVEEHRYRRLTVRRSR